ncbi:MAG: MFS transporter [Proteobacteria bacterium]|nr:MFS transporter [Pseudomonadota bacterium]
MLTLLSAVNQLDRQLINILIEPIRREFSLTDLQIGFLVGPTFVAVYSALSLPAAVIAARRSRVALLTISALGWGAMTVLCGFAHSYWHLLITRFGVGIGEAGGMPPTHALISDLYRPEERATAMSTWAAGINGGIFIAFLFGGVVGYRYGWRWALISAGILTVALALILRLTVREPARRSRGLSPPNGRLASAAMFTATLRALTRDPAMRHIVIGAALACIVGSSSMAWLPSFLVRSHGMTIAEVGIYLAFVVGIGGAIGTWLSGVVSDRLRKRDIRWSIWLVAAALLATKPFNFGFLLADTTALALASFVVPAMLGGVYVGPSLATLHNRTDAALRPMVSAVFLLVVNSVGFGFGPLLVGALSDLVFKSFGQDALRYSLVVVQGVAIWGAFHYYLAGQRMDRPA